MKHRPVYHCCNQISPEQQPVIYRPLDCRINIFNEKIDEPRSGHYYRKPHYQYEPKKSRNCINRYKNKAKNIVFAHSKFIR